MGVTFSIVLDERYLSKKTQTYPTKLRVTSNRKSINYPTTYHLSKSDFEKLKAPRLSATLVSIKNDFSSIENQVHEIIQKLKPFDFELFEKGFIHNHPLFIQKKAKKREVSSEKRRVPIESQDIDINAVSLETYDFSPFFDQYPILNKNYPFAEVSYVFCQEIKKMLIEERYGSAIKMRDSHNNLIKFAGDLKFKTIDKTWLRRFEQWMLSRGRSLGTVGSNLRSLRTVFNEAIEKKYIDQDTYPFSKRRYKVPKAKKTPKPLSSKEIKTLFDYKPVCEEERYAKAIWFFMYFANGINPVDLFSLSFDNIDGNYFSFYRKKTSGTQRNMPVKVRTYINKYMKWVIQEYGNNSGRRNYIFPILSSNMTAKERYNAVRNATGFIYRWMKKIGDKLNLSIIPGPNVSRHTTSTSMKNAGLEKSFIQEALGHSDIRTTEHYLGSFEDNIKKEYAKALTMFLTPSEAENVF